MPDSAKVAFGSDLELNIDALTEEAFRGPFEYVKGPRNIGLSDIFSDFINAKPVENGRTIVDLGRELGGIAGDGIDYLTSDIPFLAEFKDALTSYNFGTIKGDSGVSNVLGVLGRQAFIEATVPTTPLDVGLTVSGGVGAFGARLFGKVDGDILDFTTLRQTGGGSYTGSADDLYHSIRASNTDVGTIANNTGIKPHNIQKVKDHVFYNEHLLDRYVDYGIPAERARFDSDLNQALAWHRLENGTHTEADITWLKHETAERWYELRHNSGYTEAHDAAERKWTGNPWGQN